MFDLISKGDIPGLHMIEHEPWRLMKRVRYGPVMGIAALAASVVGTGLSVMGQISQANAAEAAAEANAKTAQQEAAWRREAYKEEGYKLSREKNAMLQEQKSMYGAAGIDISTGSPLDVMAQTAAEYERDIGMYGIAANQAMVKGENEASIYRYMGKRAKTAGWLGAGSTLLSGLGKSYATYKGYS
jgi:hypothetical protein